MIGFPYKDTFAGKGSDLYKALVEGDQKRAKATYEATTERMKALLTKRQITFSPAIIDGQNKALTEVG